MGWLSWVFLLLLPFHSQGLQSSSLLFSPSPSSPRPLCHPAESSALLRFKNSFSIKTSAGYSNMGGVSSASKTASWKNDTDCCTWDGVICDSISGHVINLVLGSSSLQGPFHSNNSIFLLRHLQHLYLYDNVFSGSPIPPEFGGFSNLTCLSLCNANFSGQVPVELSGLSKLVQLDLCSSGTTELKFKTYVLKRMVQNLTNLLSLNLIQVNMVEVEPLTSLMNISSSLMNLQLIGCQLRGKFPENIFRLPNLESLNLEDNINLVVSFPTYNSSSASAVRYLTLSNTSISIEFSYLARIAIFLQGLDLSNCNFIGSHPPLFANLTLFSHLTFLAFSHNNFAGQLPEIYSAKYPNIIPVQLNLTHLDLSYNSITGSIPYWICSLPFLESLDLQNNQLSGQVMEFQSQSLQTLRLSMNKFYGQIPSSVFQQENLFALDLSFNNLSGVLEFNKFNKLQNLVYLQLSSNSFSLSSDSYFDDNIFQNLTVLGLSSCNLRAFPYFLRSSKRLMNLVLSHNQIHGTIPTWLWSERRSSLTFLDLSYNFLTDIDRIPWEGLNTLDLRNNMLQGHLPILPPSLRYLFISNNQLSGEIPCLCCNMSELTILALSNNSFYGNIPSCLGNQYSLSVLEMNLNKFYGVIPDMFANSTKLRSVHLNGNQLEGPLPRSLCNCRSLEVLDVGNNKISDSFPHWLELLPTLQVLILRSNRFHGTIGNPKVKSPFLKLRIMDLSYNEFNGLLPASLFKSFVAMMESHSDGNLTFMGNTYYQDSVTVTMKDFNFVLVKILSIFTTIDLSRNNFEGRIPVSIGNLMSLKGLNFSHNKLIGSIPASLRNLTNLEWLDLSSNELVGQIPSQLTDLTQLQILNLSHNKLEGPIPSGKQFNTFNNDSYVGNADLCGFPVSKSCNNEEAPEDQGDDEEHNDGMFDWKVMMMGYGCGIVIGVSVGYMVLFSRGFDQWFLKRFGKQRRHITIAPLRGRRRN